MKEKKMVLVITREGDTVRYECIGDDLKKELLSHLLYKLQNECIKKGII